MRLVHLSDLHLGFRAFRKMERGWNLRERDVAGAFRHAIQEIGEIRPDLVLITGDLFDRPDPPSTALLTLFRGLDALRRRLPRVPVLVIAGERDTPASPADPGPVAALDALPGVEAAAGAPRAVRFRRAGVHALLVPHRAVLEAPFPELRPDPAARWNLLLIRGRLRDEAAGLRVDASEWDYVALGGDHLAGNPVPPVWTAGSLERVGWDPWSEATEEKGFLVYDLEEERGELHPVPSRPVVDLAPVRTSPSDPDAGTRRLRDVLKGVPGGVQGRILRVRLRGDILAPAEGAAPGLLGAVRGRAAHAEFLLLGEGEAGAGDGDGSSPDRDPDAPTGAALPFPEGPGVTAVTAEDPRLRRRAVEELVRRLGDQAREGGDPLALLARAGAPGKPERLILEGASLLAEADGEARAGTSSPAEPGSGTPPEAPSVEGELEALESELARARADAVEAAGEMEAGNLEWARDRQDAESRLMAYRDRARELRARLRELEREGRDYRCPTCGRSVGEGHERLLRTLEEEWEAVVQDGRWWKRRREQMEEKPEELRRLEGTALQLHARLETVSESVEVARERRRWMAREGGTAPGPPAPLDPWDETPEVRHVVRALLRRAGNLMGIVTEGSVVGILWEGGTLRVRELDGEPRLPEPEELPPLAFSLHLSLWLEARLRGRVSGGPVFGEYAGGMAEEEGVRSLALSARLVGGEVSTHFVLPPRVAERLPEVPERLVQVTEAGGGLAWAERPGGRPRIRFLTTS